MATAWVALLREHDALRRRGRVDRRRRRRQARGRRVFAVFADPADALAAAAAISRAMTTLATRATPNGAGPDRPPHGRRPDDRDGRDYVGIDVHYAARVAAAANGGQIAVSDTTCAASAAGPRRAEPHVESGPRRLKDFEDPRPIHLLVIPGAADDDRPLRTIDAPTNLPTPPTNFVGRDDDLETLARLLAGRGS